MLYKDMCLLGKETVNQCCKLEQDKKKLNFISNIQFLMNGDNPIPAEMDKHKAAVAKAQTVINVALGSVLSPVNGQKVTAQNAEDIAVLIDDDKALTKLRMTLKLKEGDVKSTDVCDKALAVINSWRQSSSHACISTLRDALHKIGLQRIDESVFGHIRDLTLTDSKAAFPSLPEISDSEGKSSSSPGEEISVWFHCWKSVEYIDREGKHATEQNMHNVLVVRKFAFLNL